MYQAKICRQGFCWYLEIFGIGLVAPCQGGHLFWVLGANFLMLHCTVTAARIVFKLDLQVGHIRGFHWVQKNRQRLRVHARTPSVTEKHVWAHISVNMRRIFTKKYSKFLSWWDEEFDVSQSNIALFKFERWRKTCSAGGRRLTADRSAANSAILNSNSPNCSSHPDKHFEWS